VSQENSRSRFLRASARAVLALALAGSAAAFAGTPERPKPAAWCEARCGDLIIDWNLTAHQVITADNGYQNPLPATRALAMMHLAMHDAVNAAAPRFATYALRERSVGDPAVAAVSAAHDVLLALYPSQKALLQAALAKSLLEAGMDAGVAQGKSLGSRAAAAILSRRANDGSSAEERYVPGTRAGEYRYVPGTDFIAVPHWRKVQPFALRSPEQFRVAPPPALQSAEYTRAFEEVRQLGVRSGAKRSQDQSHYAAFWYEFSDIGWNRIGRVVSRQRSLDLADSARLFALLNVVLADAYIAGWDSKVHYNFWRPVSAIRLAESDGNAATGPDPAWEPFLATPPIQDYPSTHSALGAAAAAVLASALGHDETGFSFTSTSADPANPVRRFTSFSEAARENADSRVMAGLHFRFATDAGLKLGDQVGRHALATLLAPVD
jgi:hypothetical protein